MILRLRIMPSKSHGNPCPCNPRGALSLDASVSSPGVSGFALGNWQSNASNSTSASCRTVWSEVRPHFTQNHSSSSGFQRISGCFTVNEHLYHGRLQGVGLAVTFTGGRRNSRDNSVCPNPAIRASLGSVQCIVRRQTYLCAVGTTKE